MNSEYEFEGEVGQIVYVKPVKVADLPKDVQAQVEGLDQLYAVHDSSGERLALVKERDMAFVLARQYDMAPVAVH